jgi:hypothetical protein
VLRLVRQYRRWLAVIVVAVAMAGAFLAWGPIGLGNGPLWLPTASGGIYSWTETQAEPVVYVLPIGNAGQGPHRHPPLRGHLRASRCHNPRSRRTS